MQSRSIRRSGQPSCPQALSNAGFWKADFEQAASVIVLCARQGASLRRRCWRNKEFFQLMDSSVGY